MKVVKNIEDWSRCRQQYAGKSVGFVPTMGALHLGHLSLIERSIAENEISVLSIYVNPTQFNSQDDLQNYPLTLDQDLQQAQALGVDYVLLPDFEMMYADGFRYQITESDHSKQLCGSSREGHFTGVMTVVMKLLNLVRPTKAYFGEKDYQQYQLIKDMVRAFFMSVEIVGCPIIREADGLAMSSRNANLDCVARNKAANLNKILKTSASDADVACSLAEKGFDVDYVTTIEGRRFVAASIPSENHQVRLIDNCIIKNLGSPG